MSEAEMPAAAVPPLAELHTRRSMKWAGLAPDVIASTVAEMDFPVAAPVAQVLHAAIDRGDLGYPPRRIRRLADAFTGFAARRLNWRVDPDQVRLLPDAMIGVLELARELAGPNGVLALPVPAYRPFLVDLPAAGFTLRQVPLSDDDALDLALVEQAFDAGARVFVLAHPHNPTGCVPSRHDLEQLAELCAASGVWVVADDLHGPLTLPGATYTPWLEVSDAARSCGIALTSASKAFNLAGLKAALLITAADRTRDAVSRLPALGEHAGLLGVLAAEAAFSDRDEWLDAILARLNENRTVLAALLGRELPEIRWTPPQAGYLAWLDCRALDLCPDPATAFLDRGRVALAPGVDYGQVGVGHVRLNFGTSTELVREIVTGMVRSVRRRWTDD